MYVVENGIKKNIFYDSLTLLSDKGSECLVYYCNDSVYKIFRKDYKLTHKTIEDFIFLSSINTSRILMPKSLIMEKDKLIGYTMSYIKNYSNILEEKMNHLINELNIIDSDIKLLNDLNIRLIDINKNNTVYNGGIYLIDPGNYYIDDIRDLLVYMNYNEPTIGEKKHLINLWNHNKINKLMFELLFINNCDIDFYILRKINEFFDEERKKFNTISDTIIYEEYFDLELVVSDSINKFVSEHIRIDENEKRLIYKMMGK